MKFLDNIEIFLRVVELGSFTRVASAINLTPGSISVKISELEMELGVRLLHRSTRKLTVTDDGRRVHERFTKIVQDIKEAKQAFAAPAGHGGKIRVIAVGALVKRFILPIMQEFTARYPGITLEFFESGRTFGANNNERDVILTYGPLGDSSLVARSLGSSQMWVAGSRAYFARHGEPQTPLDLQRHHCLGYIDRATERLTNWKFRADEPSMDSQPPILHAFNNGDSLVEAAIQGLGLVWAPDVVLHGPITQGLLKPVLQDHGIEMEGPYVLYPQDQLLTKRVRIFLDYLFEKYSPNRPLQASLATIA
ncbi:MAG: LysR family transcriptional regulator [Rhodocyclaceae bacterium]|jgi:DNA-binding transcriptional LysR family regulator|nr:LysR family transcriptional regulator [Rhodocyclaceae bacterium]